MFFLCGAQVKWIGIYQLLIFQNSTSLDPLVPRFIIKFSSPFTYFIASCLYHCILVLFPHGRGHDINKFLSASEKLPCYLLDVKAKKIIMVELYKNEIIDCSRFLNGSNLSNS